MIWGLSFIWGLGNGEDRRGTPGRQSPIGEQSLGAVASEQMAKARGGGFCMPGGWTVLETSVSSTGPFASRNAAD